MSRLSDIEDALVDQLAATTYGGSPLFAVVRGVSGGFRPALRDVIRRERLPAAFVAFVEEPTAPETREAARGARFSILVAAAALRQGTDPRHDDGDRVGAFTLLVQVRLRVDEMEVSGGIFMQPLEERFVEADDRLAVYEVMYRAWPMPEAGAAPGHPTELVATDEGAGSVKLEWVLPGETSAAGEPEAILVYRRGPTDGDYVLIDTAGGSDTAIELTDQPKDVWLRYRIAAVNKAGESGWGNLAAIRV